MRHNENSRLLTCFLISRITVILHLDYATSDFFFSLEAGTLGWGLVNMLNLLSFSDFSKLCVKPSVRWWDLELNVKGKNCMVMCLPEGMSVYLRKDLIGHGVSPLLQGGESVTKTFIIVLCKKRSEKTCFFLKGFWFALIWFSLILCF